MLSEIIKDFSLECLHWLCGIKAFSEFEQKSLSDMCASVLANFHLRNLEMSHPEMQD